MTLQAASRKEGYVQDDLNERIGVLTRREVEARLLAPVLGALGRELGEERVMEVLRSTIAEIAAQQGAALAEKVGGGSLAHFARSLELWTKGGALEIEVLGQTDEVFSFNVTRCGYAELYASLGIRPLGEILSCGRDFALIQGFNPQLRLQRTGTIMGGAAVCDFRYTLERDGD